MTKDESNVVVCWINADKSLACAKFGVVTEKDAFEQLTLGLAYHKGDGVPKDESKAMEIWSKVDAFWPKAFLGKRKWR